MKRIMIGLLLFVSLLYAGCVKQMHPAKSAADGIVTEVAMDAAGPSRDEADLIITAHIKKGSYPLDRRTLETPYTFTISVNGYEIKEVVKGSPEEGALSEEEQGNGVSYSFKKRLRMKSGRYKVALRIEDSHVSSAEVELSGGATHNLIFKPVYLSRRNGLKRTFWQGLSDFEISLDNTVIPKNRGVR